MWYKAIIILISWARIILCQEGTFAGPGGYQPQQGAYQPQQQQYQQPPKPSPFAAPATGFLHNQALDGAYNFAYQTKDGQTRAEQTGNDGAVRGSYFYTSPEGQQVKVAYTADKNGFHADSDAIPRAPVPGGPPAAPPQQYAPPPQQYAPPPQQYAPPPQQYAPPPQQYARPPQAAYQPQAQNYPDDGSYPAAQSTRALGNSPIAQYAFGDPKVVSSLQNLFQGQG